MQPFYLYSLRCGDGSLYVGHTDDLDTRMDQHAISVTGYTARRHPLSLVYICELPSREDALERELQIKGWTRAKKEALIRNDWNQLRELARRRSRSRATRGST